MLDDLLEALGRVSEGITPEQRAAGKIAMAKAAVAKSNPFGRKVTDNSSKKFARKAAKDSESDPLALKAKTMKKIADLPKSDTDKKWPMGSRSAGGTYRSGAIQRSMKRSRRIANPNLPENKAMFDSLLKEYAGQVTQTPGGASMSNKHSPRDAARTADGKSLRHPMGLGSQAYAKDPVSRDRASNARAKAAGAAKKGLDTAQARTGKTFGPKKVGAAVRQSGEHAANRAVGRQFNKDNDNDPLAAKVGASPEAKRKIIKTGSPGNTRVTGRSQKSYSKPNLPENTFMFGDLLEAWDYMEANRGADPTAQRLSHRLAKGITRQGQEAPAAGPPPTPGTPAHAQHRRKTMIKSLGMKMVGGDKKTPPPPRIPKGTKVAGVDLGDSKNESTFGEAFAFWDGSNE
jgi:hypothetical protein